MMQIATFEAIVENGQIRLPRDVQLPEKTKVYVVVPSYEARKVIRVVSPRLAHPEQMVDFKKAIVEETSDAGW